MISQNYGTFFKERINQYGWRTFYDQYSLVPYMLRVDGMPGFITYDDSFSTFHRVAYSVWSRGLGGSFMWSLDADYDGHSQNLLDAMYNANRRGNSGQTTLRPIQALGSGPPRKAIPTNALTRSGYGRKFLRAIR